MNTSQVGASKQGPVYETTLTQCPFCSHPSSVGSKGHTIQCYSCQVSVHQNCLDGQQISCDNGGWRCDACSSRLLGYTPKCIICRGKTDFMQSLKEIGTLQSPIPKADIILSNGTPSGPKLWAHMDCIQANQNVRWESSVSKYLVPSWYVIHMETAQPDSQYQCEICMKRKGELLKCGKCQQKGAHHRCRLHSSKSSEGDSIQSPQISLFVCFNCNKHHQHNSVRSTMEDKQSKSDHSKQPDLLDTNANHIRLGQEAQILDSTKQEQTQQPKLEKTGLPIQEVFQPTRFPLIADNVRTEGDISNHQRITLQNCEVNGSGNILPEQNQEGMSKSYDKSAILGKRQRIREGQESLQFLQSRGKLESDPIQQSGSAENHTNADSEYASYIDRSESFKRQKRGEDRLSQGGSGKFKNSKTQESDPFMYILKEIMTPIMFSIDKLQVLKRDKQVYEVALNSKDLKHLTKDRKEELLDSNRVYLDREIFPEPTYVITIDLSRSNEEPPAAKEIEDSPMQDDSACLNEESLAIIQEDFESPENESPGMQGSNNDSSDENIKSSGLEASSLMQNEGQEFLKPKKKKKRKSNLTGCSKRTAMSSNSLPSNLSQFTWIENTDKNKALLEEERTKVIELKKQRELLKQANQKKDLLIEDAKLKSDEPPIEGPEPCEKDEEITDISQLPMEKSQGEEAIINTSVPTFEGQKNEERWQFTSRETLATTDDIWDRIQDGHYHSLDTLKDDLEFIVKIAISQRCRNAMAKIYLTNVIAKTVHFINSKKKDFKVKWRHFFEQKFTQNQLYYPQVKSWWKAPGAKREYNLIENYKIMAPSDNNSSFQDNKKAEQQTEGILKKMKTTKSTHCNGECCGKIEDLGPFKLNSDVWDTKCDCRIKKAECSEACGCDPAKCQNRQMSMKQALKLGEDVIEKISWGIDMYTAVNLMSLLPRDTPQKVQSDFVERRLGFAIQQQGNLGFDVREALKFIINDKENAKLRQMDKEMAKVVLDGINQCKKKNENYFRVHSKGIGIFCKKKEGIQASNLIIEYFGEIYQPWSWYEKQDVLKQGQNKSNLSKELPDFYNITYERHHDDPQGYDILMVDPILYGNYSSRLSHSCNPNCSTIIQTRRGEYSIGMYALKDINYGEELCFNYCSVTESEKEYEAAVCLCGTEVCQGRFLQLASDKKHLAIMKLYHTFIDRNYIIWKACKFPDITQEDNDRLIEFGLKESIMNGVPDWLKKWASLVCEYILFEESQYPRILQKDFPHLSENDLKIDAKNLRDGKLWNVAITIDKIMHVLRSMNHFEPPVRDLSNYEKYTRLWEGDSSFKQSLVFMLTQMEDSPEKLQCLNLVYYANRDIKEQQYLEQEKHYEELFNGVRASLAQISDILRPVKSQRVTIGAFCDILWLYANTETYFTPNENYKKCKGEELKIRKCDVRIEGQNQSQLNPVEQEKTVYKGSKEYDPGYIWGQLVGWFKQTVDKPNASLSADRRGTLSMPDLESFIVTSKNQLDLKSGTKRKKKAKGKEGDIEEEEVSQVKKQGTKSRPSGNMQDLMTKLQKDANADLNVDFSKNIDNVSDTSIKIAKAEPKFKEPKAVYPHKKHQTRQAFLENWADSFSKQWDVCCHWNFKNRQKMYGSVQFDSIMKADTDRQRRLDLFNTVVNHLLRFN